MISFKVLEKREGKENTANVDGRKAKEENLEFAEGKCLKGFWLSALNATGEIFNQFPKKVIFDESAGNMLIPSQNRIISQRLGFSLPSPCWSWWPTHSSPSSSTTTMAEFNSFGSMMNI